jgi:dephospho-CoA kinase
MKALLQIGITGGIGSGKSIVCKIFRSLGVPVYNADQRARELMLSDEFLIAQIRKEFGNASYHPDGSLNRQYLAQLVFEARDKVEKLNQMVHPRVRVDFQRWVGTQLSGTYILNEAALLIEAGTAAALDKLIVVSAPESLRIKRVLQRDPHRTETDIRNIMKNQMPEAEKVKRADFVILNDDTQLVIPQVLDLHRKLMNE